MEGIHFIEPTDFYNILNQEKKYPMLSDQTYLLLFDVRNLQQFKESHIITAKLLQTHDDGTYKISIDTELETKRNVVVYDDNTSNFSTPDSKALNFARFLWDNGSKYPVKVVKGGYERFTGLYPFLRTQEMFYTPQQVDDIFIYPVEIIPGFLYLGTHRQSQNGKVNKDLKIKAHLNVSDQRDAIFKEKPDVKGRNNKMVPALLEINVLDRKGEDVLSWLPKVCAFIDSHDTRDGEAILISSPLGISRSVTAALAYMIHRNKCSLQISWDHMKKCKNSICPNRWFINQLLAWELETLGEKKTVLEQIEP